MIIRSSSLALLESGLIVDFERMKTYSTYGGNEIARKILENLNGMITCETQVFGMMKIGPPQKRGSWIYRNIVGESVVQSLWLSVRCSFCAGCREHGSSDISELII